MKQMAYWLHSALLQQLLRECVENEQMAKGVFNIHSADRGGSGSERPSHRFSRMFLQSDGVLHARALGDDWLLQRNLPDDSIPLTISDICNKKSVWRGTECFLLESSLEAGAVRGSLCNSTPSCRTGELLNHTVAMPL